MIRIPWEQEEAVALFDVYFRTNGDLSLATPLLENLSLLYRIRAKKLGIKADDKFRNITGLKMQFSCVDYVISDGCHGLSNANKLFYQTYQLYKQDRNKFDLILNGFYSKYLLDHNA